MWALRPKSLLTSSGDQVLSRPSGCFLKPIPSLKPIESGSSSLLSFRKKDLIWVCPPAADVVELFIYLAEPCHVCQLLLTVSHGADDSSYPATVDVRTGCNLDGLKLILEEIKSQRLSVLVEEKAKLRLIAAEKGTGRRRRS